MYKNKISIDQAIKMMNIDLSDVVFKKQVDEIGEKDAKRIYDFSKKFVADLSQRPGNKTLMVGSVQSGKTSTFLSVISFILARDVSNCIMIFPSVDTTLLNQTKERLNNTFNKLVEIVDLQGVLQNVNSISAVAKKVSQTISRGKKVIFIGLKNKARVSIMEKILLKTSGVKFPVIFDDEGDQASFDNVTFEDEASTYASLSSLQKNSKAIGGGHFITITATPYAHIFVDNESNMKPQFAYLIPISDNYTGIKQYHNDESKMVKTLTPEFVKSIKDLKKSPELETLVIDYLVRATLAHLLFGELKTTSMLIHTHKENAEHNKMNNIIQSILNQLSIDLDDEVSSVLSKVIELAKTSEVKIDKFSEEKFLELFKLHIRETSVVIGNQSNEEFKSLISDGPSSWNSIYIGSQMIQRGVTFPNLISTIITYRSSAEANADTILQRARWFGYRKSYIDLTRIYTTEELKNDFTCLLVANDDLFERLNVLKDFENKFAPEFFEERLLVGAANLRGTRLSVGPNGKIVIRRTLFNSSVLNSNVGSWMWEKISRSPRTKNSLLKFKYWDFPSLLSFKEEIGAAKYKEMFDELIDGEKIEKIKFFEEVALKSNLKVNVVMMGQPFVGSGTRERSIKGKNFSNLFQGSSNEEKLGRADYYYGDAYLQKHKEFTNSLVIQIHKVKDIKKLDKNEYYKVAMFLPMETVTDNVFKK